MNIYKCGVTPKLAQMIIKLSHGKCLDAGCGDGRYFEYFNTPDLTGVDITQMHLDAAVENSCGGVVKLLKSDVSRLPFEDNSFDFVLCADVLVYMKTEEEKNRVYAELERICKKGGVILISLANGDFILEDFRKFLFVDHKAPQELLETLDYPVNSWTYSKVDEITKRGYKVYGCMGHVSYENIKPRALVEFVDRVADLHPRLGGTLLGVKKK